MPRIRTLALLFPLVLFTACSESTGFQSTTGIPPIPVASLSTTAIAFGNSPVGAASVPQSVTLTNTGGTMTFSGVSVTGTNASAFLTSTNCPATLAKGASCTVSVAFEPGATGNLSATLNITDNAVPNVQTVGLIGTGTATGPIASLSATSLTFTSLPVGQAATQTVTLSNIGTGNLTLNGFTLGGANATSFQTSGGCLTTAIVTTTSPCYLTITYAPTVAGSLNAVVNVNDSAPNSPQTITLTTK